MTAGGNQLGAFLPAPHGAFNCRGQIGRRPISSQKEIGEWRLLCRSFARRADRMRNRGVLFFDDISVEWLLMASVWEESLHFGGRHFDQIFFCLQSGLMRAADD